MTRTVVVGGGAAGVPLAARLGASRDVTLIEAGPAPRPYPAELLDGTTVVGAMPGHPLNWSYPGLLTPDFPYTIARGRVLGGSSVINGGYFVRARPSDFDRWADVAGSAWSYEQALPVLAALENDHDFGGMPGHGASGPMPVARPAQHGILTRAFTRAARELGFAEEPDKNLPGPVGVGPVPANVIDGVRVNTALAYLGADRDRVTVRAGARALRVRFEGDRAVGVETAAGFVDADEVVLCAGGIGTPHLLLASGVGPRAHLEAFGVRVVSDVPVGESFSDHPDVAVSWRPRGPVIDPGERVAFPTALNFDSSGRGDHPDGDLEVLLAVKPLGYLLTGAAPALAGDLQLIVGLQSAESRGRIALRSADPTEPPVIEYGYLQSPGDRERLRAGIRTAVALLRTDAFADVCERLTELDDATLDDDGALDAWVRMHLGTAIHLCGSAPMGPVLDGAGRVHGVRGLRVADTSMLPDTPSRGPFATAVFLGEHMARLMLA